MNGVGEIESALRQLSQQGTWRIARWLLDELEEAGKADFSGPHVTW